ncbi:MAG: gamma-glutamyltransferase family protein [Flammeovirgaceae bacterium TMED290]|nr:MAG: gamma-glutamyltransferase family protein [Flammeovirgaceae bacterium TMED290]
MKNKTILLLIFLINSAFAQNTNKPILHGKHWIAITGKPLGATAGALIFNKGGNAVDAACAMVAATATMWDVLGWGGETQALIYHPKLKKVIGINALGVAPSGATPKFYKEKGYSIPPKYGPLSAVTPGTPAGIMVMLAEYGTMSLEEILQPSIEMAKGYPIEAQAANSIERNKDEIKKWKYSRNIFLTKEGQDREAPNEGEIFVQKDLHDTLLKLIESEKNALKQGKNRKEAIYEAYKRFYEGDIAEEIVRSSQEEGGLITKKDLKNYEVHIEEPLKTSYKNIDIYKLTTWVQSPVLLQSLNMAENINLKSMGFNSANYIHNIYQIMNLSFADRDFYYGDPYFEPVEPIEGLLSKDYARDRIKLIADKNNEKIKPGNPYVFQDGDNPFLNYLESWETDNNLEKIKSTFDLNHNMSENYDFEESFMAGTTTVQAADSSGWIVSITPSGGWIPAVIAGKTGIGLSQRMQSFVLDPKDGPYNVLEPGKRPRATLTPTIALKDNKPFLSFAVQGGDSQDQNLLQFFLNMVEFDMNIQEACEAPNINSFQMRSSFGYHENKPGELLLHDSTPPFIRKELRRKGYKLQFRSKTSGPINAIFFDTINNTFQGGSSDFGEDYGIAW